MINVRILTPAIVVLLFAVPAFAGGLFVNEFSTTSQANAGAGRGAWAPDASAALHNPASMTELDDHGFATGFSIAAGRVEFDPEPGSASGGGNQAGAAPLASFSYVHKASDRVRVGLSFYSLSGSVLDPDDDWAGRFQMTNLSLLTVSISPTVAIQLTDWLSIGGGPIATYASLNWDLRADFPVGNENTVNLKDFDDWQAGGRVGLFLEPFDSLSLSVYYNSAIDFDLSGELDGPLGVGPDLDVELPLAQVVEVSAAWQATEALMLLGTFAWEDWSEADDLEATVAGRTVGASTGFEDTYRVSIGANYQLNESWLLQTGIQWDSSALQNGSRTTAIPIDDQIRFALGFQYDWSESLTVGGSFVYVNLGQGEVRQGTVRGDYEHNDLFVLGLTLSFKELPWAGRLSL